MIRVHAPGEKLDYLIDWQTELNGDTIAASSWVVTGGLTKSDEAHTLNSANVWLTASPTFRGRATATNMITTSAGREQKKNIELLVQI